MLNFKLKTFEVPLTTQNSVANSTFVRVYNANTADMILTANNGTIAYANCTIAGKTTIVIQKAPTDLLSGGANLLCVGVATNH